MLVDSVLILCVFYLSSIGCVDWSSVLNSYIKSNSARYWKHV